MSRLMDCNRLLNGEGLHTEWAAQCVDNEMDDKWVHTGSKKGQVSYIFVQIVLWFLPELSCVGVEVNVCVYERMVRESVCVGGVREQDINLKKTDNRRRQMTTLQCINLLTFATSWQNPYSSQKHSNSHRKVTTIMNTTRLKKHSTSFHFTKGVCVLHKRSVCVCVCWFAQAGHFDSNPEWKFRSDTLVYCRTLTSRQCGVTPLAPLTVQQTEEGSRAIFRAH